MRTSFSHEIKSNSVLLKGDMIEKCYFFVDDIETSFVYNELLDLSYSFKEVIVVSKQKVIMDKPNITSVVVDHQAYNSKRNFLENFFFILRILVSDFDIRKPYFNTRFLMRKVSTINRCLYVANKLQPHIGSCENSVYYSFWFNDWATVLSILKSKRKIKSFFSRVHGADLFEERVPVFKRLVLRRYQLKHVRKVFSVSRVGEKYLRNKYPEYSDKMGTFYLGTKDQGMGQFDPESLFTIVSCAHVRNIKRIFLIPEILKTLDIAVRWIHIGAESKHDPTYQLYIDNVEKLRQENKKVVVELKGKMTQKEIMDLYKNTSISLFLSVSSTEGLPVSMMEAISFGIPIMSTDVGGCSEIVTKETGVLIPADLNSKKIADIIESVFKKNTFDINFRTGVREFWKNNFDAEKNAALFLAQLRMQ